jgi:nucleotide-binding universal stress UspA family protein
MKQILIPTDFSDNAVHAAKAAVMLSAKLNANILLFNNYVDIPVIPHYAGGPWVADDLIQLKNESNAELQNLAQELDPLIAQSDHEQRKLSIHTQCGEGNLGDNIAAIIHEQDIELVVIGARSDSTIDHFLYGSETSLIIDKSTRPVFIIPPKAGFQKLQKVLFATNFDEADIKAIDYLAKLSKLFDFQLEIVHVNLMGKAENSKNEQKLDFIKQLLNLKYQNTTYKEILGKDVINRLNSHCDETEVDVLAMMHHHYTPFMRMLKQSTSKKALSQQKIPLLIFSSKMGEHPKLDHYKKNGQLSRYN